MKKVFATIIGILMLFSAVGCMSDNTNSLPPINPDNFNSETDSDIDSKDDSSERDEENGNEDDSSETGGDSNEEEDSSSGEQEENPPKKPEDWTDFF